MLKMTKQLVKQLGFSAQEKPRKKGREFAVISLSPSEFPIPRAYHAMRRSLIERSIIPIVL